MDYEQDSAEVLDQLLVIDEDNLANEWHSQPRLYARAGFYAARCEAAVLEAELALKVATAEAYCRLRRELVQDAKRPTEEYLKHSIMLETRVQECDRLRNDRVVILGAAKSLLSAFGQRAQSLKWLCHKHIGVGIGDTEDVLDEVTNRVTRKLMTLANQAA